MAARLRRRTIAYLGVGSNLDEPAAQVRRAFGELDQIRDSRCVSTSSLYLSVPLGPVEQPDFVNAVAVMETGLSVEKLLESLQALEESHGRRRNTTRWGPRTLDLDILLYGNRHMNTGRLILPHPELHKRNFVLYPLLEVTSPDLHIPGRGRLGELIRDCRADGIKRLSESCLEAGKIS